MLDSKYHRELLKNLAGSPSDRWHPRDDVPDAALYLVLWVVHFVGHQFKMSGSAIRVATGPYDRRRAYETLSELEVSNGSNISRVKITLAQQHVCIDGRSIPIECNGRAVTLAEAILLAVNLTDAAVETSGARC